MSDNLLIELLTEELPPKRLKQLSDTFAQCIYSGLLEAQLITEQSRFISYGTPRRLAVTVDQVRPQQPQQRIEKKGPNVKQAHLADGSPSPALQGFMRSSSITQDQLVIMKDNKGQDIYGYTFEQSGKTLEELLPDLLHKAFSQLPVAKIMRWGDSSFSFVRPVHGLVVLHGKKIIDINLLGIQSGNITLGHRFLSSQPITLSGSDHYAEQLKEEGCVIARFDDRKKLIHDSLKQHANGLEVVGDDNLLNEVTSLVEWPQVLKGQFDKDFLNVPSECLILSMQQHQKYFPLKDNQGQLQPQFLLVSNLNTSDPHFIIDGNERVLRARLSDAQFFYQTDLKTPLIKRLETLKQVIYVKSLGSVYERVYRIKDLARIIAKKINADILTCEQAAELSKADLTSEMVGEFPELQGIMGKYYALNDGYSELIAEVIEDHYHPRFANDTLPRSQEGIIVAIAEKLESLVGLFACGQIPTGDKDPYGLRRASLGVIRLCIEGSIPIALNELIEDCASTFTSHQINSEIKTKLAQFIIERLKGYLKDQYFSFEEIESILPFAESRLDLLPKRLLAIREFSQLSESKKLAAANKRIKNILKKNDVNNDHNGDFDQLTESAETNLINCLKTVSTHVELAMSRNDFNMALTQLIPLAEPINHFFDEIMIISEDLTIRSQRISLLLAIYQLMQQVADIGSLDA
ncbi:glycine--tRNA ligase subunit beta [Ferrovum sp. PN-J185]|uniref:glycine--tRNA ligase subunit beta n=1 Tax=Ferrovum sp. PN-J185 TaxID=1356306 RepID=UPI000794CFE9|nr:glycine--tRNA ligase subunit beta [Ferrovum sp. PN-J185]KXW55493.1 glycine--tRNA ligase beta subunit [Ferrovum sp. PN-J185]